MCAGLEKQPCSGCRLPWGDTGSSCHGQALGNARMPRCAFGLSPQRGESDGGDDMSDGRKCIFGPYSGLSGDLATFPTVGNVIGRQIRWVCRRGRNCLAHHSRSYGIDLLLVGPSQRRQSLSCDCSKQAQRRVKAQPMLWPCDASLPVRRSDAFPAQVGSTGQTWQARHAIQLAPGDAVASRVGAWVSALGRGALAPVRLAPRRRSR